MRKSISLIVLCAGMVFASGTITPGSKAGLKCATTSVEGNITFLDVETKTFSVGERKFKVSDNTAFRIPGATKDELKNAPLSKMPREGKVKVQYCTKDGTPVEVKIEK
jgi:hypothetical protein